MTTITIPKRKIETKNYQILLDAASRVNDALKSMHLTEKHFQKAFVAELREHFKSVQMEYEVNGYYTTSKGTKIQIYRSKIDILLDEKIILELKTQKYSKAMGKKVRDQCKRYLLNSDLQECYIVVFDGESVNVEQVTISKP